MNTPARTRQPHSSLSSSVVLLLIILVILVLIAIIVLGVLYYKKEKTIVYVPSEKYPLNQTPDSNPARQQPGTVEQIKEEIIQNEEITDLKALDQKIILNLIQEYGGSILQKDLVKASKFSKAKISRLLKDLENQGLIERKPVGQTFLIRLV